MKLNAIGFLRLKNQFNHIDELSHVHDWIRKTDFVYRVSLSQHKKARSISPLCVRISRR